ncbi:MAG TPA: ParB N-terminal domain-containing protein [Rudaea sp.]|nr:ParB N-terminal domain-containing protein [Rudaea sp.]
MNVVPDKWIPEEVSVNELLLDPANPRLTDFGLDTDASQLEILQTLWRNMAVDEVALSIAENGFYQHEPLYAARENGQLYVIEGNRRLAAVKLLRDVKLQREAKVSTLPAISAAAKKKLDTLPVIICKRSEIWAYLGFKHINGPQAWESYPKASYVAWVHNEVGVSLDEIARRIGDKHSTVARLYDALMVLEQAEENDLFDRADRYKKHFSFSHLTTGLGYLGIQEFLGLPKGDKTVGKRRPIAKSHYGQLRELLSWLYGSKSRSIDPVIQSQNPDLRNLDAVLRSKSATAALRRGLSLSVSLDISKGDELVFRESLVEAKQSLVKARGYVVTGYDGNEDLLKITDDILELSQALRADMSKVEKAPAKKKLSTREA